MLLPRQESIHVAVLPLHQLDSYFILSSTNQIESHGSVFSLLGFI
jgi:hypothetical protein